MDHIQGSLPTFKRVSANPLVSQSHLGRIFGPQTFTSKSVIPRASTSSCKSFTRALDCRCS